MPSSHFHQHFLYLPSLNISLDTSQVPFPSSFFEAMQPKIARALQDMSALEAGGIANPDEHRMVGHYWLRNHALAPSEGIRNELQANGQKRKDFVEHVLNAESRKTFKNLLCIGIGGSALGPQLLSDAFGWERDGLQPFFIDNTDPDGIGRVLRRLEPELEQTLVMVTSKSGSTPEPRNGLAEVRDVFHKKNLPFAPQAVAVTCEGSALDGLACEEQWLARFPMWDWVGGRTSLFSNVGLLPAALQGIATEDLLQGAAEMDAFTRETDVLRNPALMLALSWYACTDGHGKRNMVILPYRDALVLFPKYLQQLVMESLGKKLDLDGNVVHQGLTVYGNKGSTDQHAYVQQLRDGLEDAFVTFIEVQKSNRPSSVEVEPGLTIGDFLEGFFLGTRAALSDVQRPSITITLKELNERSLGALVALFERAVGFYASFIHINAYHQPGVEAGKKAAKRYLELQKSLLSYLSEHRTETFSVETLANALKNSDAEDVFKILEYLAANERIVRHTASPLTQSTYGLS